MSKYIRFPIPRRERLLLGPRRREMESDVRTMSPITLPAIDASPSPLAAYRRKNKGKGNRNQMDEARSLSASSSVPTLGNYRINELKRESPPSSPPPTHTQTHTSFRRLSIKQAPEMSLDADTIRVCNTLTAPF